MSAASPAILALAVAGAMAFAVTNTFCQFFGTSLCSTEPVFAIRSMSSSEYQPSSFAIAT